MTPFRTITFVSALILFFCSFEIVTNTSKAEKQSKNSDSITLEKYKLEIIKEYVDIADLLTKEQIDSVLYESRTSFAHTNVIYSPDKTFKIFVIEVESCGGYCNSEWYSWIHFKLKSNEIIKKVDFLTIDTIHKLSDNKFLIIENRWGRPASVFTIFCLNAHLISFASDSIITHPIKYRQQDYFGFCQESGVDLNGQPYIKYDQVKKILSYYYGNNYAYPNGPDVDTIRQGEFKYIKGQFVFKKEVIKVNDRSNK